VTECGGRDLLRKKHGLEPKSARMEDRVLLNDSIDLEVPLNSIVTDWGASGSSFDLWGSRNHTNLHKETKGSRIEPEKPATSAFTVQEKKKIMH
jgi:hypothetical protein